MANKFAYGFHTVRSTWNDRVTEVGVERVNELIQVATAEHNRQLDALLSQLATADERINTNPTIRHRLPSMRSLQPVDELGVALPRREAGYFDQSYPLHRGEDAFAQSYEQQQIITVGEVNDEVMAVQRADAEWNIHRALFAILHETTWTYEDDQFGTLTVKPLANGDADTYPLIGGAPPATDDHYLAQANSIDDSNDPFPTIFNEIEEHPVNSRGDYVCFVPTNLVASIQALTDFVPLPQTNNIIYGNAANISDGAVRAMQAFGDRVIGVHESGVVIVRWRRLPDNYMVCVDMGNGGSSVLRYREHPAATLRGLINIQAIENSGNVLLNRFRRIRGFAVANRVGAVVMRIGNASYANPTGFTAVPS